jgi:hypothetical protein
MGTHPAGLVLLHKRFLYDIIGKRVAGQITPHCPIQARYLTYLPHSSQVSHISDYELDPAEIGCFKWPREYQRGTRGRTRFLFRRVDIHVRLSMAKKGCAHTQGGGDDARIFRGSRNPSQTSALLIHPVHKRHISLVSSMAAISSSLDYRYLLRNYKKT